MNYASKFLAQSRILLFRKKLSSSLKIIKMFEVLLIKVNNFKFELAQ